MQLKILKSKIHRATVVDSNLEYEGSVTIDSTLLESAGILEYEHVNIWDLDSGARVETYAIRGEPDSGNICINGAAARHIIKGDKVIISSFAYCQPEEAKSLKQRLVLVDKNNKIKEIKD